MGRIWIVAVGRVRHPGLRALVEEYLARAARLGLPVRMVEVKEAARLDEEGRRMLALSLPPRTWRVALDDAGRLPEGSPAFAAWLQRRLAVSDTAFFVGGARGLDGQVLARCDERLSLSPLTMAHELARAVLAEQIYRAATLWRGVPYPK